MMQLTRAEYPKYTNSSHNLTAKKHNPIKYTGRRLKNFSKENIQIVNRHMKRQSTSLIIRDMQIKTKILTSVRMAIIKKSTNNKC